MDDATFQRHLKLLESRDGLEEAVDIAMTPIFTEPVRTHVLSATKSHDQGMTAFSQYGLFAADIREAVLGSLDPVESSAKPDPRIFYNVTTPSSVFICGSQGSGKSHTLSCLLENCLVPSEAAVLPRPLTGLVFHYDTFVSEAGGLPCEAAFLSSEDCVKVRVLCPPTNVQQIKRIYSCLPNVAVEELRIKESDLNTKRMLDLMAVSSIQGGGMPLYLHVVTRILRDLRVQQQQLGTSFDYGAFKMALAYENLTDGQRAPLQQRLETLESFMAKKQAGSHNPIKPKTVTGQNNSKKTKSAGDVIYKGNNWSPVRGQLTIVDMSCPCVTPEMACALFNICLSLFLEQESTVGRVVALDEAHKFMTIGAECQTLTESLLSAIRLQRHIGVRVYISTQEPTISPRLLDLCSITIVHRFSSPNWLHSLEQHLVGVSVYEAEGKGRNGGGNTINGLSEREPSSFDLGSTDETSLSTGLLSQIVQLRRGEALMFAPGAIIETGKLPSTSTNAGLELFKESPYTGIFHLGKGLLKVRIRQRVTADGGRSVLAG